LPKLTDGQFVYYVNFNRIFLNEKGLQNQTLYNRDLLHLNDKGYLVWANALKPLIQKFGLTMNPGFIITSN
jgi:lysophospholipase L1-like esterase